MSKVIVRGDEARNLIKKGIDEVVDSVKVTLGPRGRNVMMQRYGGPLASNDGVRIAGDIEVDDPIVQLGVGLSQEVASKADDNAGDGTTTALVLLQALADEGLKKSKDFPNRMEMRRGMEAAKNKVVELLKDMAKPVSTIEEIIQVATISAESAEMGKVIGEAIDKMGKDGAVTVEESLIEGITSEVTKGFQFDNGYVSPYMVTDSERMVVEYSNVPVLVTDKTLSAVKDVMPIIGKMKDAGKMELVIIAEDIVGEALSFLLVNKVRGIFNTVAVKAPGFGERKKGIYQDIAIATGNNVITREGGLTLDTVTPEDLGGAAKVFVTKDKTVIVEGMGSQELVDKQIEALKGEMATMESKHDIEQTKARVARLAGGVAVIKVGATTQTESTYLKHKVEDAVNATRAAIEEGIVCGGGAALVKAQNLLIMDWPHDEAGSPSYQAGVDVVTEAILQPARQIAMNAGINDEGALAEIVAYVEQVDHGFDAKECENVEDMYKAGIIDPVKVTRTSLERAVSSAAIFLTTEVAIAEKPQMDLSKLFGNNN